MALRVIPPIVAFAVTVTVVSLATSPDVSKPELEIVVAVELSDQFGVTDCELPSLKRADAVNCPELFSFREFGPLMARDVNTGATCTMVIG